MTTLATILDDLERLEKAARNATDADVKTAFDFMRARRDAFPHLIALARAGERLRQEYYSKLDQVGATPAKEVWDAAVEAMVKEVQQ